MVSGDSSPQQFLQVYCKDNQPKLETCSCPIITVNFLVLSQIEKCSNFLPLNTFGKKRTNHAHHIFLDNVNNTWRFPTQPVNTCSKLTIEALEQGVKYVQS